MQILRLQLPGAGCLLRAVLRPRPALLALVATDLRGGVGVHYRTGEADARSREKRLAFNLSRRHATWGGAEAEQMAEHQLVDALHSL